MEREVGGGIGMGNTCKPMAVSFQCMTKFTTNKKNKKFKKKISINHATNFLLPEACPLSLCYAKRAWANPGETQGIGPHHSPPLPPPSPRLPRTLPGQNADENACSEGTRAGGGPASLAWREDLLEPGMKFCLQK